MAREIPSSDEKKTIKKKEFNINDFKEKFKINDDEQNPLSWLPMSKSYQDVTGLEGIPHCELTLVRGYSDTGKSTFIYEAAVAAQQNGELPIIIDTENAMKKDHLKKMGFDFDMPYMYIDTDYLLQNYGKKYNKDFSQSSIEDIGEFMNNMLDEQEKDNLQMDIVFCIDSFGSSDCRKTLSAKEKDKEANNMWNAGAMEQTFKGIFHQRIPSTRKTTKKYKATAIAVQKIWFDNMNAVIKHKGGEAFFFGARLILHFGGILTHGTKKKNAEVTDKGVKYKYQFGVEADVRCEKNQVTGIEQMGKIMSTSHGYWNPDKIDEYKKKYKPYILQQLTKTYTNINFDTDADINVTTEEVTTLSVEDSMS